MTTRILIARHGNTFTKGQTPRRIGRNTDLPLIEEDLGRNLGKYLKKTNLIPKVIFVSPLKRTMQTAKLVIEEINDKIELIQDHRFVEIDYGPDENKTEDEVESRIGKQAIDDWNKKAIVPNGWQVDPEQCIQNWMDFAQMAENMYKDQTIMVISSNGVIRFSPYITKNFDAFIQQYGIKVATGRLCIFEKSEKEQSWKCTEWNRGPL